MREYSLFEKIKRNQLREKINLALLTEIIEKYGKSFDDFERLIIPFIGEIGSGSKVFDLDITEYAVLSYERIIKKYGKRISK